MYLSVMSAGTSIAFALIRVPRGAPPPSEEILERALAEDRKRLGLPAAANAALEPTVAGPYAVLVDGAELDEYVVWER